MSDVVKKDNFYTNIRDILQTARDTVYKKVNFVMVEAYWNIGKQIVEEEQNGEDRAKYGSYLIKELSKRLTKDFGKGFTTTNLKMMRQFYNSFPNSHTLCDQLTWSHYRLILRVKDENTRQWYVNETASSNWSVRALERQIGTHYYERTLASKEKEIVKVEAKEKTKDLQLTPKDIILCTDKDNTVVKYSSINENDNLFVSKYQVYLPSEEELKAEIERDIFELDYLLDNNLSSFNKCTLVRISSLVKNKRYKRTTQWQK